MTSLSIRTFLVGTLVLLALLFTAGLAAQQTPPTESPPPDESTSSDPAEQQELLDVKVLERFLRESSVEFDDAAQMLELDRQRIRRKD